MHLRPTYPIESTRLQLRPVGEEDATALLDYHASPDVHRFLPMGPMDAESVMQRITSGPWSWTSIEDESDSLVLGVELRETGQLVGDVMLAWSSRRNESGEIGYVFNPSFAGRGYATEAADELLRLAFMDLGLHRVVARIVADNEASLAVAARLGMRKEAYLVESWQSDGAWYDEVHCGILRSEWIASHPDERAEQRAAPEG